jgi:hypothetical protein
MSNVVEFPGAEPEEIEWTQDKIDEVHGRAFRDLETGIFDCMQMSGIAAQLMLNARLGEENEDLNWAVFHLDKMLRRLKEDYEARWYPEKAAPVEGGLS